MPRALPLPLREQIVARHQQGEPLNQIAKTQGLSYRTVLACWRRFRRAERKVLPSTMSAVDQSNPCPPNTSRK